MYCCCQKETDEYEMGRWFGKWELGMLEKSGSEMQLFFIYFHVEIISSILKESLTARESVSVNNKLLG